jgi:peroxiredoxin family protein/TusA-related sulfurtransferase
MEAIKTADVELRPAKTLDCRGMQCPAPILELSKAARGFGKQPVILEIIVDDDGFPADLKAWCRASKNSTLSIVEDNGFIVAHVGINIGAVEHGPESGARAVAPKDPVVANDVANVANDEAVQPSIPSDRVTVNAPNVYDVNCRGMQCPAPILTIAKKAQELGQTGGLLHIVATDPEFPSDLKAWCHAAKARLLSVEVDGPLINAVVAIGEAKEIVGSLPTPNLQHTDVENDKAKPDSKVFVSKTPGSTELTPARVSTTAVTTSEIPLALTQLASSPDMVPAARENRCTLLVIKNDFESLMAAMMCASTAAAQGMETSIFFSFWGVNVLRADSPRRDVPKGRVSILQKMMKWMMPRGPKRQKMSKMHMGGVGKGMMQYFMKKNNVLRLEELMAAAVEQNVKFIVCSMSMGIMGIQKRDIVDLPNIEFAGVSTFIELSRRSSMSLVF